MSQGKADLLPRHAKPLLRQLMTILRKSVVVPADAQALDGFSVAKQADGTYRIEWTYEAPEPTKTQ